MVFIAVVCRAVLSLSPPTLQSPSAAAAAASPSKPQQAAAAAAAADPKKAKADRMLEKISSASNPWFDILQDAAHTGLSDEALTALWGKYDADKSGFLDKSGAGSYHHLLLNGRRRTMTTRRLIGSCLTHRLCCSCVVFNCRADAEMTKLFNDMVTAVLASLDISAAEKKTAEEAIPFVVDVAIAEMDTNGDDKISLAEFTAAAHVFQFDN